MDLITKKCSKCCEDKSQFAFTLDNAMKDGLCIYCKVCKNQKAANKAKNDPKRKVKNYGSKYNPRYGL